MSEKNERCRPCPQGVQARPLEILFSKEPVQGGEWYLPLVWVMVLSISSKGSSFLAEFLHFKSSSNGSQYPYYTGCGSMKSIDWIPWVSFNHCTQAGLGVLWETVFLANMLTWYFSWLIHLYICRGLWKNNVKSYLFIMHVFPTMGKIELNNVCLAHLKTIDQGKKKTSGQIIAISNLTLEITVFVLSGLNCVCAWVHPCACARLCAYMHVCACVRVHACVYAHVRVCVCVHTRVESGLQGKAFSTSYEHIF